MTDDEAKLDILRSAMESARDTIKSCLLINAGSAAVLIAFLGHLVTRGEYQLVEKLAPSTMWFALGVLAAIIAHGFSYCSNLFFVYWPWRWGQNARYAAVAATLLSTICFICGAWTASDSLLSISKVKLKTATIIQGVI